MPSYADIVLPLAQPAYTFAVPDGMRIEAGTAVVVQFGLRKFYTGIAWRIHDNRPDFKRVKPVQRTLYDTPLLTAEQMRFWEWVADYYMCSLGEVMRVALPSLVKPSGNDEAEFVQAEYRPRTETYIALASELHDTERLQEVLDKFERRAPKQYAALLQIASEAPQEIARRLLDVEMPVLHALQKKGFILCTEHERTVERGETRFLLPTLTPLQNTALEALQRQFAEKSTALLYGVTGSGKTEIYIHLIAQVLSRGGDALLLVPEIAITAQLIARLERIFGSRVTSYHSKLTLRQRTETYFRLNRSDGGELVVGARSALFLPLGHLQLIVVDEEHDGSYKQTDPAPRYHARDCAVMLAKIFGAHTLLGSATPSLETWLNAQSGKYGLATLPERYGDAVLPTIIVSDTLRAVKRGERHTHFNKILSDKIRETLARGGQAMLFQNRRGYSPFVSCPACGWIARCPACNVTLTYHKAENRLMCHYCGHTEPLPAHCPACNATDIAPMGFGTEKVEAEITRFFPEARVARLDRDSATSERAFRGIVADFEAHRTDILVGTQMITKGFDFEGVSLVGILNADNLLNHPDFRASERAFQLMMQVAGRAGRRAEAGEVVIQTAQPEHPIIREVAAGDYETMAREQLAERAAYFYPPYARLFALTLRHRDADLLRRGAAALAARLRARFGRRILGPITPPVERLRGEYMLSLLLKIESGSSSKRARELLATELHCLDEDKDFKHITVVCNVDPQ